METSEIIKQRIISLSDATIAEHSQQFFKTNKGEYGEGDQFLGIRVPVIRKEVKHFKNISIEVILQLLNSQFHEIRLFSLLSLVQRFSKGTEKQRSLIYKHYLKNTSFINNWDLVDSSAPHIVGSYLENRDKKVLYKLAQSESLWERRIAIMATFYFIKGNQFDDTLKLSSLLLGDSEDLIHKAVGWMLREIGNRSREIEEKFLFQHSQSMPRTMLRYAIEKFPEEQRKAFLR